MNNFEKLLIPSSPYNPFVISKAQLIQTRDTLIISLINQLSFNRALLKQSQFSLPYAMQAKIQDCQVEAKREEFQNFHPPSTEIPVKINRRIIRSASIQGEKGTFGAKNDTKNIPKNYGKAILSYILRSPKTRKLTSALDINLPDFLIYIRKMKGKINSIDGLKKMWGSDNLDNKTKKCIRILSYQFMRKHYLRYIFHSKVRNYGTHIKYRQKIIQGIQNPDKFNHIKDF